MKSAPPTVPGMPSAYSRPARPRATAARARRPSCTAAPAWMEIEFNSAGGPSSARPLRGLRASDAPTQHVGAPAGEGAARAAGRRHGEHVRQPLARIGQHEEIRRTADAERGVARERLTRPRPVTEPRADRVDEDVWERVGHG